MNAVTGPDPALTLWTPGSREAFGSGLTVLPVYSAMLREPGGGPSFWFHIATLSSEETASDTVVCTSHSSECIEASGLQDPGHGGPGIPVLPGPHEWS